MAALPVDFLRHVGSQADADSVLDALSATMEEYRLRILEVKTHRNALAPISRLPPEVLSEVFVTLMHNYIIRDHTEEFLGRPRFHGWIAVTFVCRRWRETALRTPRLWSTITLHGCLERIRAFLSRSSHAPLSIRQPLDRELPSQLVSQETLQLVVDNLHRTARLDILMDDTFHSMMLSRGFHAPVLADLRITLAMFPLLDYSSFSDAELPRLQTLRFKLCPFSLIRPLLRPTISELSISDPLGRQSTGSLVALIQGLPLLEELTLENAVSHSDGSTHQHPPANHQISLPRLKSLDLIDSRVGTACADFLNHILIPASTKHYFETGTLGTVADWEFIFKSLARKATRSDDSKDRSYLPLGCEITETYRGVPQVELWNTTAHIPLSRFYRPESDITLDDISSDVTIQLASDRYLTRGQYSQLWDCFLVSYPLSEVRSLSVNSVVKSMANWRNIEKHMPKLEELELTMEGVMKAFLDYCADAPNTPGRTRAFPSLKHIGIRVIHMEKHHKSAKKRITRDGSLVLRLIRELEARQALGIGIDSLQISSAYQWAHQKEDVERLADLVHHHFGWDSDEPEEDCSTCGSEDDDKGGESSGGCEGVEDRDESGLSGEAD